MKSERRRKQLDRKRAARKARFSKEGAGTSKYARKSQFLKRENHRRKKAMGKGFSRIFGFDFSENAKPWK